MRLSTILALVLAVVFAAANPFALLIKRDSTTSMTSTASTEPSATSATFTSTLTTGVDSSSFPSATSSTSDDDDKYIYYYSIACFPRNATGHPDFNAPCNQYYTIMAQCEYGPQGLDSEVTETEEWQSQSPETQRTCVCQSQMTDAVTGCMACMDAHKVPDLVGGGGDAWKSYFQTTTQQYCDVDFTPTQGFLGYFEDAQYETFGEDGPDDITSTSSIVQDPLGFSADVSVYYTMSATRSDAFDVAMPTPAVSGGDVTYTTTRISDGQIVPTTQAEKEAKQQDLGEAGTSSISISTSSTSSFSDSSTKSSAFSVSRTRSLGIATPSTSQSSSDDERGLVQALEGCYPSNATGHLDFNAPCNQAQAILAQCAYGPNALQILTFPFESGDYPAFSPNVQKLSSATERICICQSQLTDVTIGCLRCNVAHHILHQSKNSEGFMYEAMQQYCDLDYTTTQSFSEISSGAYSGIFYEDYSPLESYTAEAISTSTDVSLYYTLSVTRSDAYDIALPTSAAWPGNFVSYTSTQTSGGQIVPTAREVRDPDSPTTDSGAASMHAGPAGMLAMAALAALGL
jgi:hypothetical protein